MGLEQIIHSTTLISSGQDRSYIDRVVFKGFHLIEPQGEILGYTSGFYIDSGQNRVQVRIVPLLSAQLGIFGSVADLGQIYEVQVSIMHSDAASDFIANGSDYLWEDVTHLPAPDTVHISNLVDLVNLGSTLLAEVAFRDLAGQVVLVLQPTALGSFMLRRFRGGSA